MSTIDVMRKALEALEFFQMTAICQADTDASTEAITALRAELERMEAVEPVAWFGPNGGIMLAQFFADWSKGRPEAAQWKPLYTAPIAPSIPGLSWDDIQKLEEESGHDEIALSAAYALAAERAGARVEE